MLTQQRNISPSIFRAYDIRGIVDQTLTKENVYLIGKTLGMLALEKGETELVVARDGRVSGDALSIALSAGILSVGCDIRDIGMVPTPLLYFATTLFQTRSGVMLTGSHNPAEYNGLKMVICGKTLTEAEIQSLCTYANSAVFPTKQGVRYEADIAETYIAQMKDKIRLDRQLTIVIDAGNGVTGEIAPRLFEALGCRVHTLFCEIDGSFPNHHPDPSQPENLQALSEAVTHHKADVGLAFDGDGDRLGIVTSAGKVICADRLLMLFAKYLDNPVGATVVFDVKCTNHLPQMVARQGGHPVMSKTGHSHIKAKMAETQAVLGGEMSGHFFFKDRWFGFDDGLYAGVRLLEILAKHKESSDALFADIPDSVSTPELKMMVPDHEKFSLMQSLIERACFTEAEMATIDGLRVSFKEGWGLVRPSNTMPYLVLRFEAVNAMVLDQIQSLFREWMLSVDPNLSLPF
ncbi:MAG TPA: phosphomannomutase/phosphoglucomutase [Gammaproteobacteria bacterium]|jgi:phosphomannomutase/phosphoglucomutase|nr:phosphomannomutase/phosphoglucomutase [Gammaproteobacteria bacterium]